jgi:hypothetical protein
VPISPNFTSFIFHLSSSYSTLLTRCPLFQGKIKQLLVLPEPKKLCFSVSVPWLDDFVLEV